MEVSLIMIDEPCYKPPEPSFVITAQPQTLIMFRIAQQQKYNVFQRNCQKENFVWALINILVPNIFWGKLLFWNLDILRWFPKRRSKRAAEKIILYFWFVLEMRSKTKSKLSLTHNVNDLIGGTFLIIFWECFKLLDVPSKNHVQCHRGERWAEMKGQLSCFVFPIFDLSWVL